MKILVKRERVGPVVTTDRNAPIPARPDVSEEELNSEVELLKGRDLLERVVLSCNLQHSNGESLWAVASPTVRARETNQALGLNNVGVPEAVRTLEKELQVEPLKKTSLIKVTYKSPDPQQAALVLTTLANLYLEKHVAVHRPTGAFGFFQQEAERYQKELAAAEARLADYTRGGGAVSAELEKQLTLQKLTEFDASLQATQSAVAETEDRILELEIQLGESMPRQTTQIRKADNPALLQQLKSTLLNLELKETELLGKFEPNYRLVQEVRKEIAQTRSAIATAGAEPVREETTDRDPTHEWVRAELAKSKAELAALRARAIATAGVVHAYLQKARLIDQQGTIQNNLIRAAKAAEENYLLYQRKEEEARISDALDRQRIVNVAIAEAATVPALSTSPRWSWILLMGGLLSSLVSVGLAFVSDYLDPSFRTPDELQDYLHLPVLAATPKIGR
ncbi:MAG: hypothetical protein HY237_00645 [Acidobacteria bacterium]|nr:hypothetical protein [Acidobacteriota bacterium]